MEHAPGSAQRFHELHARGRLLRLPNAWDAGSARLVESLGAEAIATTSAGVAWSCGWPDGDALPPRRLADVVASIARVVSVPISADAEGGYGDDAKAVAGHVAMLIDAGAVGVNLEDGGGAPEQLVAKIEAVGAAARHAGVELFVNARTDVYLRGLVPPERALDETLARGRRYRDAGASGLFVPYLSDAATIRSIVAEIDLPLNLLVVPGLPPIDELAALGVRRVSAGSGIASAAYATARRATECLLREGRYEAILERQIPYPELNALFPTRA